MPENITSYVLNDLSLLKYDNYKWQVEAVSINNSGLIDQRGVIMQHSFRLGTDRSDTLQTRQQQGIIYGQ